MKTPREILIKRHQSVEPKLDAIRQSAVAAVAAVCDRRGADSSAVADRRYSLRELLISLRWHLAGMSAVWVVVALLQLDVSHSPGPTAAIPMRKIPSAQIIMASLRENRRLLWELIQPPDARDAGPQRLMLPQPHSQRGYEILNA